MQRIGFLQTVYGMVGLVAMSGLLVGCFKNDRPPLAQPAAERPQTESPKLPADDEPVADISLKLAKQAAQAAREGRIDEARETFAKATKETTNLQVLDLAWDFHFGTGDLATAEEMLERYLAISGRDAETAETSAALGNLGLIYKSKGELDRAEVMHQKALAINEKLGRQESIATQYAKLGVVAEDRGDVDRARELWTKARDLFAKIGRPQMGNKLQGWLDKLPSK